MSRPSAVAGAYVFADRASLSDLQSYLTLARQADPEAAVRLHALGTSISALQNTARFRLAGAVPAKVLADMLDFSVATFENYARLAAGTRGDYPALRGRNT